MAVTADFERYVLEQLAALERVVSRRMFGGVGLYRDGAMFALIAADVLYFKVGDANRADFESCGANPFRPHADRPTVSLSYFELPVEVLEDAEQCVRWARQAVAAATAAATRTRRPAPKATTRGPQPGAARRRGGRRS